MAISYETAPSYRQRITAWIAHKYPFLSGCGTFANSKLLRSIAGNAEGVAWAQVTGGPKVLVPLEDYVGRAVFFVGDLDRKITKVIQRIVRRGDTVLDIGANLGLITVQFAQIVGPQGHVYAFEPNPLMVDFLTRTAERNSLSNVSIQNFGLGAKQGELELQIPSKHAGRATMNRDRWISSAERIVVPVKTLDSFIQEHDLRRVRLVKLDVEGFEMEVLRGATEWLAGAPADAILFESNESPEGGRPDPVMQFLAGMGYSIFAIEKTMVVLTLSPHDPMQPPAANTNDFLAVCPSCKDAILEGFHIR